MTPEPVSLHGVYAITPDDPMLPRLLPLVRSALDGGVRLLQYRNKYASPDLRRIQAKALLSLCRLTGAKLIVNDDVWLAVEIGADGAHIGRDDAPGGSLSAAREALGPHRILGVSCYNELHRAEEAAAAGADYLAFGAVFPSPTKPRAARAELALLQTARERFGLPVCAIGGITPVNAREAIAAGADMVAVLSSLFDTMDIRRRAREFQNLFNPARAS
jgi:thiamine-phosphate pyrophosphorylase